MSNALAVVPNGKDLAPFIAQEKVDLIKRQVFPNATDLELEMFINLANTKRLDPLTNQIYAIKYGSEKAAMFASIDGLRVIAKRAGDYGGQTQPYWCGPDKVWTDVWLEVASPVAAKVGVYIKGCEHPTWGVAHWKSYAFDRKGQAKGNNWKSMPEVMLAKCAEAIALRKAFPDDISGLYIREEFAEAPEARAEDRPARAKESRPAPIAEVSREDTGEIQTVASVKVEIGRLVSGYEMTNDDLKTVADELALPGWRSLSLEDALRLRDEIVRRAEGRPAIQQAEAILDAVVVERGEPGNDRFTES